MAEMKTRDSSVLCIRPSLALQWIVLCRCRTGPCGALRATCGSPDPARALSSFELPVTVEKTVGTIYRAAGRERPHELFGRLKAEKVGSLPPVLVFFPRCLLLALRSASD